MKPSPPVAQAGLLAARSDLKARSSAGARWNPAPPKNARPGGAGAVAGRGAGTGPSRTALDLRCRRDRAACAWPTRCWNRIIPLIPRPHVVGRLPSPPNASDLLMADGGTRPLRPPAVKPSPGRRHAKPAGPPREKLAGPWRTNACCGQEDRGRRHPARSTASCAPAPAATCCARPGAAHRPQPARLRPLPHPSAFAVRDGRERLARLLLEPPRRRRQPAGVGRAGALGHRQPEDRGGPIGQALACWRNPRASTATAASPARSWWPLEALGRPRIDVVITLSASSATCCRCRSSCSPKPPSWPPAADEPVEQNFVRKHALAYQQQHGCDLETARCVFGNAEGTYGANVNHLIDNGRWDDGRTRETYTRRKGFAYGRTGRPVQQGAAAERVSNVDLAYQNLDSLELGVTTIDHLLRHAGRHQPRCSVRARGGGGGARRRRCSPSRAKPARPEGDGMRTATKACARSRCTSPTRRAGRRPRGNYLGSKQLTETFMLDRPCVNAWREHRVRQGREPTGIENSSGGTGSPTPPRWTKFCAGAGARNWKTASRCQARRNTATTAPAIWRAARGHRTAKAAWVSITTAPSRHRQGLRHLRQGRHRQAPRLNLSGGVQQTRQAGAADRLRPQARLPSPSPSAWCPPSSTCWRR